MENFIEIDDNIQTEIIEKKSKFICNIYKVVNQKEAEDLIKKTKKIYHDARHNCIAYRIMENNSMIERFSDDGEPSGTAGAPMMNILRKNNLCNILVIVTRYFGGILLGTGGLVRAYSDSLVKALNVANKVEKCLGEEARVVIEYNNLDTFKYYCKNNSIKIVEIDYLDKIICKIHLEENVKTRLIKDFEIKNINLLELKFLSKILIDKCKGK